MAKARIARAKYLAKRRRALRRKRRGLPYKMPKKPESVRNVRRHNRKILRAMKKKFKQERQKLRQKNNRSGATSMDSNVKMSKPPIIAKGRMLMIENYDNDPVNGRRRLVGLS